MKMAMDIEVFSAGCRLCEDTVRMVKRVMGPECTLRIYDLTKGEGLEESRKYGVRAVPTIVGNGRRMFEGIPEFDELIRCSIQHGCKGRLLEQK